jgi:Uma2 family endonuclease
MTTARRLVTADELLKMPDTGKRYELIRGVLVERMPAGDPHSIAVVNFTYELTHYTRSVGRGVVRAGDPGYRLERNPDTVRAPDVAWFAPSRLAEGTQGYPELAPDLAVEVKSPTNSRRELAEKAAMWLSFGSREVWVADPETVTITVYRPGADPITLDRDDELDGGDLLPGFSTLVGPLFSDH